MIAEFQGKYRFLSNFYRLPGLGVELDGLYYPTVEHAFVAAKTLDEKLRAKARACKTPGEAKRLGRTFKLRDGWDDIQTSIMLDLVRQKFDGRDPVLRAALVQTGEEELVEGNTWGDRFWGVCSGVGQNNLGKILMKVRTEIRAGRG